MSSRSLRLLTLAITVLVVTVVATLPSAGWAEPPPTLTQQGRVLDAEARPLSGEKPATFRLYVDDGEGRPGELVYEETLEALTFVDGYYTATLGMNGETRLPAEFAEQGPLLMTLQIEDGEELPAQRITAVPYAFVASHVEGTVDATQVVVGGTTIDELGITTQRLTCSGCVDAGALANGSVDSAQLAAGAVQPEHVAGGVMNALTRGQLYSRTGSATSSGVGQLASANAVCDEPGDVPISGECFAGNGADTALHRFGPLGWEDTSAQAGYSCTYKSNTASSVTVEARIHCLDVTP